MTQAGWAYCSQDCQDQKSDKEAGPPGVGVYKPPLGLQYLGCLRWVKIIFGEAFVSTGCGAQSRHVSATGLLAVCFVFLGAWSRGS